MSDYTNTGENNDGNGHGSSDGNLNGSSITGDDVQAIVEEIQMERPHASTEAIEAAIAETAGLSVTGSREALIQRVNESLGSP